MKPLTEAELKLLAKAAAIGATREYFTPEDVQKLKALIRRIG